MSQFALRVIQTQVKFGDVLLGAPIWEIEKGASTPTYAKLPITLTGKDKRFNPDKAAGMAYGDTFDLVTSSNNATFPVIVKHQYPLNGGTATVTTNLLPTALQPLMARIVRGKGLWFAPKRNYNQEAETVTSGANVTGLDHAMARLIGVMKSLPYAKLEGTGKLPVYFDDLKPTVDFFYQYSLGPKPVKRRFGFF